MHDDPDGAQQRGLSGHVWTGEKHDALTARDLDIIHHALIEQRVSDALNPKTTRVRC